eukprot:TRINITY_DN10530_c0_g1_i1.p1 TRINITY_DN10530_c0_g1~~TRINITY_DN10530_c0_g1_i1.p1  ORF type:complete len:345 (-),score=112.22 TRINITY_DN10530_c0_g1_i1:8-1042(-)
MTSAWSLPVEIPEGFAERQPQTAELLRSLQAGVLAADGSDVQSAADRTQARARLDEVRRAWVERELLCDELGQLELEHVSAGRLPHPRCDPRALEALSRYWPLAEAAELVREAGVPAALELTPQAVFDAHVDPLDLESDLAMMSPMVLAEVERRCRVRLQQLHALYYPNPDGTPPADPSLADLQRVPAAATEAAAQIEADRERLAAEQHEFARLTLDYQAVETDCLLLAVEMLDMRLDHQLEFDRTTAELRSARIDALTARTNAVLESVLADTYTKDKLEALKKIRRLLEQKQHETDALLAGLRSQMRAYDSAGSRFKAIAEEYAAVVKQLQERKWQFTQLQQK